MGGGVNVCSSLKKLYNVESSCTCLIRPSVLKEVAYGQDREAINSILNTKIISLDGLHNKQCYKIYSLDLLLIFPAHIRAHFEISYHIVLTKLLKYRLKHFLKTLLPLEEHIFYR